MSVTSCILDTNAFIYVIGYPHSNLPSMPFISFRRGSKINSDRFPKQRQGSSGERGHAPPCNFWDFLKLPKVPFPGFLQSFRQDITPGGGGGELSYERGRDENVLARKLKKQLSKPFSRFQLGNLV